MKVSQIKNSLIFIGMPGSGKSTIGVQLAKRLHLSFIDSDLLIQENKQQKLQCILNTQGYQALRNIEEQTLLALNLNRHLVSTGGSAIYSDKAMQHLKAQGLIIYLKVSFNEIRKRIDNEDQRGIARPDGQTLKEVYHERQPLYKQYADITIDNEKHVPLTLIEAAIKRCQHDDT